MVVLERKVDPQWLIDIDTTEDLADISAHSWTSLGRE
jgi:2-phospho-L-lactate guanylyltransferase (CobY/MobA/RfbA family)